MLVAASAARTAEFIARWGYTPVVVDISEYERLEGSVTCLSVLIPSAASNSANSPTAIAGNTVLVPAGGPTNPGGG